MVSLPRTCEHCSRQMMHYSPCTCPDARLANIDIERAVLTEKIIRLDAEERRLLKHKAER